MDNNKKKSNEEVMAEEIFQVFKDFLMAEGKKDD